MSKASTVIARFLLLLGWACLMPQQDVSAQNIPRDCDPVGRVLTAGFLRFKVASQVCRGDRLQVTTGAEAKLLCFATGQVLVLTSKTYSDAASKCIQAVDRTGSGAAKPTNYRIKPKGPGESDRILIAPYGNTLIETRPVISWFPVPGADTYLVEIGNRTEGWQATVKADTKLPYPSQETALEPGHAYKITITAMRGDSVISASEKVVNLLNEIETRLTKADVERIKNLNLPQDEAAYLDLNSIYKARNLLGKSIATLEARVEAGSNNASVYRTLGDRYLEADLPGYAKRKYEMAARLAKKAANPDELNKAQVGLKAVQVALVNEQKSFPIRAN